MKRLATLIASIVMCATMGWAQSGMTDNQVMDYVIEQNANGVSRQQIVTQLMQRGVTIEQIRRIQKNRYAVSRRNTRNKSRTARWVLKTSQRGRKRSKTA